MKRNAYDLIARRNRKELAAIKRKLKLQEATVGLFGILVCGDLLVIGAFPLGVLAAIIFAIIGIAVHFNVPEELKELQYYANNHIAFGENITMLYGIKSSPDDNCDIFFGENAFKIISSNKRYAFHYNRIKSVVFTSQKGLSRLARGGTFGRKSELSSVAKNVKKQLPKWSDGGEYVFVTYLSRFHTKTIVFKIYYPQRSADYLADMLPNGVVKHIF